MNKFSDQVRIVDPRTIHAAPEGFWERAISDSDLVQEKILNINHPVPLLRLWPQTYDTEGFFSAVLEKVAPTRAVEPLEWIRPQETLLPRSKQRGIAEMFGELYGDAFLDEGDVLYERGEQIILASQEVADCRLPVQDYALGMPFAKMLAPTRAMPSHEIASLRGQRATRLAVDVSAEEMGQLLSAKGIACEPALRGHAIVRFEGHGIGVSLAKDGRLTNNLPRWMVGMGERTVE